MAEVLGSINFNPRQVSFALWECSSMIHPQVVRSFSITLFAVCAAALVAVSSATAQVPLANQEQLQQELQQQMDAGNVHLEQREFTAEDAEAFASDFNRTAKAYSRFAVAAKVKARPKKTVPWPLFKGEVR